eukprot:GFUD01025297.1.p1 GENE.GFUD01025297.1~~GFUD01025297.1.p1  ORF type:complete len:126 (-),score=45.73 GFUD01025297.1:500-877(-)
MVWKKLVCLVWHGARLLVCWEVYFKLLELEQSTYPHTSLLFFTKGTMVLMSPTCSSPPPTHILTSPVLSSLGMRWQYLQVMLEVQDRMVVVGKGELPDMKQRWFTARLLVRTVEGDRECGGYCGD